MNPKIDGKAARAKVKFDCSIGKVLATIFRDFKWLIIEFLYERRTANAAYYCHVLDKANLIYWSKRRGFRTRSVLLLYDNAPPHCAAFISTKTRGNIVDYAWTPTTVQILHPVTIVYLNPIKRHVEDNVLMMTPKPRQLWANDSRHSPLDFTKNRSETYLDVGKNSFLNKKIMWTYNIISPFTFFIR